MITPFAESDLVGVRKSVSLRGGEMDAVDGQTLAIDGTTYAKGIGTHAPSDVTVWLGGACSQLRAAVGIDDEAPSPARSRSRSSATVGNSPTPGSSGPLGVDVGGVRMVTLKVTDGGGGGTSTTPTGARFG
ncbi:NPCBM/NEW2 domain-containing protein [Micromonospora cremea]|uniref:NPCBM/NEW2 domain-containing protein n=1 Tax=Micromonospora cremea TaxID=709881 RepID=UPI0009410E08|nr:NPCBM/NEW2 domain-containing protein [Micromonospora cremea]